MVEAFTWEELAERALGRQFPRPISRIGREGPEVAAVVRLVDAVGPIQSQAARAPYLSIAARLPGATRATVTAAHEARELVRSTSLRSTVHTSTRAAHAALHAVARRAQAGLWRRVLKLDQAALEAFWDEVERLSEAGWPTHDELEESMRGWLAARGHDASVVATSNQAGRFAFRGHAAMLRKPVNGEWDRQGEVGYRSAAYEIGEARLDPQTALVDLVRRHVAASGPVSRRDLAWWSGDGLRNVDAAIVSLRPELVSRPGPDGQEYVDLAEQPSEGEDPGIRLLPEYDALLLAYDPPARQRFASPEAISYSWNARNGVHSPTVLVGGRLRGRWQVERRSDGAVIDVQMFPGERLVDAGELSASADAVGAVLDLPVTDVRVAPWPD